MKIDPKTLRAGMILRHLKTQRLYRFIATVKHSETLEEFAVYKHEDYAWARPLDMFCDGRFEIVRTDEMENQRRS